MKMGKAKPIGNPLFISRTGGPIPGWKPVLFSSIVSSGWNYDRMTFVCIRTYQKRHRSSPASGDRSAEFVRVCATKKIDTIVGGDTAALFDAMIKEAVLLL